MISLFDGAITIRRDNTPLLLDEETRALYNRAITDPTSLTDSERRRITRRPPADEDALCQQACGLSMTELLAKAIATHNNGSVTENNILSFQEANLIIGGVVPGQNGRFLSEGARLSKTDRDLIHRTTTAALTEEMRVAHETALAVQKQWLAARIEAANSLNYDDIRNIR